MAQRRRSLFAILLLTCCLLVNVLLLLVAAIQTEPLISLSFYDQHRSLRAPKLRSIKRTALPIADLQCQQDVDGILRILEQGQCIKASPTDASVFLNCTFNDFYPPIHAEYSYDRVQTERAVAASQVRPDSGTLDLCQTASDGRNYCIQLGYKRSSNHDNESEVQSCSFLREDLVLGSCMTACDHPALDSTQQTTAFPIRVTIDHDALPIPHALTIKLLELIEVSIDVTATL